LPSTEFTTDELKLLLVAVRQMRRTFAAARKRTASAGRGPSGAGGAPPLAAYEALYDELFEKLRRLAGPIPEAVEEALE
jgi:hypothetical protein